MKRLTLIGITLCLLVVIALWQQHLVVAKSAPTLAPAPIPLLTTFGPGSLIIPMDTSLNGQDDGMLRAYGLVYTLLRSNVPVHWVINPAKPANGDDFFVGPGLQNFETSASIGPRAYRGGPFIIDAADAAAAIPIIQAWQATAGDDTMVHRLMSGSLNVDVARKLLWAPRIAILQDGNEVIAFNDLNAAGILDSMGQPWSLASPDVLTEVDIKGPTINPANGALFHSASGLPRYCYLASMHYDATGNTPEVVQEVRSWLDYDSLAHAFMQCQATLSFENDSAGHFLTSNGIVNDGPVPSNPLIRVPAHPVAQIDDIFPADAGTVSSIGLAGLSTFKTGVTTLINQNVAPLTERIVLLTGRHDGDAGNGKVTYLTGHDYSVTLPITSNSLTNGVRLFLNSLFESDCATAVGQADVVLTKSAPAFINDSEITYTISFTNPGPRPVENVRLTDKLPLGATYVVGSGIPVPSSTAGGVLTWNLPSLASGAGGSVIFKVNVNTDATYTNAATMDFSHLTVRKISSNSASTVRDTVGPTVTITSGPTNPTNDVTPTFGFVTEGSPITTECRVDMGPFVPCSAFFTTPSPLSDGLHTFQVRVSDAASNTGSASRSFVVDTVTLVAIDVSPSSPLIQTGSSVQFTAIGHFSDGSNQDLTAAVTWSSSVPTVATISNAAASEGVATAVSAGTTVIKAQLGAVFGDTTLFVTPNPCLITTLLDDFNRHHGGLGSNWKNVTGPSFYRVASNGVDPQLGPVYWNAASFGTSQSAFVTLKTVNAQSPFQGLLLKAQTGGVPQSGAIVVIYDPSSHSVRVSTFRPPQLTWTPYDPVPVTFSNGDKLRACVTADGVVTIYKNDMVVATVFLNAADQTYFNSKGGKIGLWTLAGPNSFFDDFGGGNVTP